MTEGTMTGRATARQKQLTDPPRTLKEMRKTPHELAKGLIEHVDKVFVGDPPISPARRRHIEERITNIIASDRRVLLNAIKEWMEAPASEITKADAKLIATYFEFRPEDK